jgi:hypothetical protein
MKKREAYELSFNENLTVFRFTSEGPKGRIKKVIEFSEFEKDVWNLGFGDETENDWDDRIMIYGKYCKLW